LKRIFICVSLSLWRGAGLPVVAPVVNAQHDWVEEEPDYAGSHAVQPVSLALSIYEFKEL
jgi:hypothetical protein